MKKDVINIFFKKEDREKVKQYFKNNPDKYQKYQKLLMEYEVAKNNKYDFRKSIKETESQISELQNFYRQLQKNKSVKLNTESINLLETATNMVKNAKAQVDGFRTKEEVWNELQYFIEEIEIEMKR